MKHRFFSKSAQVLALTLASTAAATAQGISVFTAGTAGESLTTSDLIHSFDTSVRTSSDHTLNVNETNIEMVTPGKHLVIYNSRFDSTGGSNRTEVQSVLNLAGADLAAGRSQGYIRRSNGQDETITAGGAIIDVASANDVLQLHSYRTDNNGVAPAIRENGNTGIQLVKLDDGWDYLRLVGHDGSGTNQSLPVNNTSWTPITYTQELEEDTGSFDHPMAGDDADIILKTQGHYLVFANTYGFNVTERTSMIQRLSLDGTPVDGSITTSYIRGNNQNSCGDGCVSLGMIIETTAPNQTLNVEIQMDVPMATTINGPNTAITIVKLPETTDYIRLTDSAGGQNLNASVTLEYNDAGSQLELDTGSFAHDTATNSSRVTVNGAGDYLFLASQYDANDGVERGFYNQGWQVNGSGGFSAQGQTGRYSRSTQGVDSFANWSGFVAELSPADYVETLVQPLGNGGTNTADRISLQALKLDFGPDLTPPDIASTSPAQGATNVYVGTTDLVGNFSEEIVLTGAGFITLIDTSGPTTVETIDLSTSPNVSVNLSELTVTPTVSLVSGTTYEVVIDGNALEDTAGTPNAYPGTGVGEWTFTVAAFDGTGPALSTTDPVDDATGVPPTQALTATFDKDIVAASGDIRIVDVSGPTTLQTIAISDETQVATSGSTLTITPATLLPANVEVEIQIDAGAVVNLSDIAFGGTSAGQWTFTTTDTARFTSAANSSGNDTWNQGGNWDLGTPPTSTLKAVINTGLTATAEATTATYSGGLTLETGAGLTIRDGAAPLVALGTGPITMDGENTLTLLNNTPDNINISNDISILGNLAITNSGNGTDNETRTLSGTLSGAGQLTYTMRRGNTLNINGSNGSWSGGFVANCSDVLSSNLPNGLVPGADNAFGTGDVTMNNGVRLVIPSGRTDTIGDSAALSLNGIGRDGFKLQLSSDETIGELWVDGIQYPAGTYSESGATDFVGDDWISGSNILTVSTGPSDGLAPTVVSIEDNKPGGQVFVTDTLTYTVTFSDPILASSIELADFETTGSATTSVDSLTPLDLHIFEVVVSASTTGTVQLQVKAGTTILDFGQDALDTTFAVSDDTVIDIIPFVANSASLVLDFQETLASEEFDAVDTTWGDTTPGRFYHISVNSNNIGYGSYIALDTSNTPIPPYTRSFADPVVGWSFIGGGTNNVLTVSDESGGVISWTTTDTVFDSFGQDQKKFWTATDPGPGFNVPANEAEEALTTEDRKLPGYRSFGQATATIDISGLTSGTAIIFYGAFSATPTVDAILRDSSGLHPDIVLADLHTNGDGAQRTEYYAAEVSFTTDGIYDTIVHNYLQPGTDPGGMGNGRSGGIVVLGVAAPAGPYDNWATTNGVTGGPTDDDDSDNLTNLLEFAFGTDPQNTGGPDGEVARDGSANGTPIVHSAFVGGDLTFEAVFARRDDFGQSGSVNYTVQFSADLVNFVDSSDTPAVLADSAEDSDYDVVSVPYPFFVPDQNGDQRKARFFRLKIDEVP